MRYIFVLLLCLPALLLKGQEKQIYLSPRGNDANTGTASKPLKSLEGALEWIKAMEDSPEAIAILMKPGVYTVSATVEFSSESMGGKSIPVHIRPSGSGEVILRGGQSIPVNMLKLAKDKADTVRLHPVARGKVFVADLKGCGLADSFGKEGKYSMLAWNEHLLSLARWPNRGYNTIAEVIEEGPTTRWLKPGPVSRCHSWGKVSNKCSSSDCWAAK